MNTDEDTETRQPYYFDERELDTEPEQQSYGFDYDQVENMERIQDSVEYMQAFNDLSDEDDQ